MEHKKEISICTIGVPVLIFKVFAVSQLTAMFMNLSNATFLQPLQRSYQSCPNLAGVYALLELWCCAMLDCT